MRISILGGDGYVGWPTAMYLAHRNHDVTVVDSFHRRHCDEEIGASSLIPIVSLQERVRVWSEMEMKSISVRVGDVCDWVFL
jgi:UDP-sulfoquinovose synthase